MDLLKFDNKKGKVIDKLGNEYIGMMYYEDADTAEEPEDTLVIRTKLAPCIVYESEIESIEILEK